MSMPFSLVRDSGRPVTYVDMGGWLMAVFIPSRKRTRMIADNPLLSVANVYVHESEVGTYQQALGLSCPCVIGHDFDRMPKIMNGILDLGWADPDCKVVLRLDDDMRGLRWTFTRGRPKDHKDPQFLLRVIWQTAIVCMDLGAGVFGYNTSPKPYARNCMQPFLLRNVVFGNCFGVVDRRLRSHTDLLTMEDMDLCLASLRDTSMILTDQRWHPIDGGQGVGHVVGGVADTRTSERHDADLRLLEKHWPGTFEVYWGEKNEVGMTRSRMTIEK